MLFLHVKFLYQEKQYFELEHMESKEAGIVAEASVSNLLDNTARVHTMRAEESC
jgi:hypothetical protein